MASFDHGVLVKLAGSPAMGSQAVAWSKCDNVNGANECEVTMSAAKAVTATFAAIPQFLLTVGKSGSGSGTVTSAPTGIVCGAECSHSYLEGTLVKLTGAPGANSKAVVWETCPGTVNASNQCEVTMSQARAATARFDLELHTLTVTKGGSGSGTVTRLPGRSRMRGHLQRQLRPRGRSDALCRPGGRLFLRQMDRRLHRHRQLQGGDERRQVGQRRIRPGAEIRPLSLERRQRRRQRHLLPGGD